jgi:hypothetical protein
MRLCTVMGVTIYGPAAYKQMRDGVSEGLKLKFPEKAPQEIDMAARQLTYEMKTLEAKRIKEMSEKGDSAGIEKELTNIRKRITDRKPEEQAKKDREREEKEKKCQK